MQRQSAPQPLEDNINVSATITAHQRPVLNAFRGFQNQKFKYFWTANFLVYVPRWMQLILLAWFVLELTDSPWLVSLVGFFTFLPMLLFGIIGGLLTDCVNRRALLGITQLFALLISVVVSLLFILNLVELWHVFIAAFLSGSTMALDLPSRSFVVHDLLGPEGVTNGMALDSVGMTGSTMVGPAIAGFLITLFDVQGGFIAMVTMQLTGIVFLWLAKIPTTYFGTFTPSSIFGDIVEGLEYTRTQKALVTIVAITIVMNLLLFPVMQMIPVIARDVLHVGPGLMGLLVSASGIGSCVGSLILASFSEVKYHGRIFLGGSLLSTLALLILGMSQWYSLSFIGLLMLGIGVSGFAAMQMTLVMLIANETIRGRALGAVSLAIGISPWGAVLIGAVAGSIGTANAVTINAGMSLILLVIIGLAYPRFWRVASTILRSNADGNS